MCLLSLSSWTVRMNGSAVIRVAEPALQFERISTLADFDCRTRQTDRSRGVSKLTSSTSIARESVGVRRQGDDPRVAVVTARCPQVGHQQRRQQEGPKVVDSELVTRNRRMSPVAGEHHPALLMRMSIRGVAGFDLRRMPDAHWPVNPGPIATNSMRSAQAASWAYPRRLRTWPITNRQCQVRACGGQSLGGLQPDATGRAGDDGGPASELNRASTSSAVGVGKHEDLRRTTSFF